LALVGTEGAHAFANLVFGSPERPGEIFASAESGGELIPVVAAVALGSLLLGLALRVAGRSSLPPQRRSLALPFACLPPLAFVLLEGLEAVFHRGSPTTDFLLEPAFLAGLVLQFPLAIAGYAVARLVLRLGDVIQAVIRQQHRAVRPFASLRQLKPVESDELRGPPRRGSSRAGRAPPPPELIASG
jgi:hypothetical protein